ncbi:MAG TPA: DNA methyltransferase, partial [Chitinophagales bacterium]|nr:DNA methyltransferase [Chitinophagales bacterium]
MEFELSEIPQHLRKYFTPKHKQWIVRNDIIWAKRNGMPESVTDRFSKKHEYFFFMVKNEKYYFDLDAIRDKPITGNNRVDTVKAPTSGSLTANNSGRMNEFSENGFIQMKNNPLGKNPGSVSDFWDITTKPNKLNHYATYNESLIS